MDPNKETMRLNHNKTQRKVAENFLAKPVRIHSTVCFAPWRLCVVFRFSGVET